MKPEGEQPLRLSSLSAIFPAFNDGGTIASMVIAAQLALRQVTDDFEIIVVNDGSRDYTAGVLDAMQTRYPELKVIHHPKNRGYGAALRSGFAAASREWIFYTDGDAQYNPFELPALVDALQEGVDLVNGYKRARHDSLARIVLGRVYHWFVTLAFGIRVRDVDCDFRLIRREALERLDLESEDGTICLEMVKKMQDAGCRFAEVPVHHYPRPYGRSQFFTWTHLWRTFRQLLDLYWKLVVQKPAKKGRGK